MSKGEPKAFVEVRGASEHNLKNLDVSIERRAITVVTGVSGSGKSSLAFDTVLAEAQRRFFYTLSHYSRQFLDLSSRPAVKSLTGLSPAIALAQNETQPSRRATVGSLTDVSELIAVLCARFGEQRCPEHGLPTGSQTPEDIVARLLAAFDGQTVALCAPIVDAKKGVFKKELTAFGQKGYLRAYVDGQVVPLAPPPTLAKDEKHTIKLIIDYVKVKADAKARLMRAVQTALAEGEGFGEYFPADAKGALAIPTPGRMRVKTGSTSQAESGGRFSTAGGCPVCGFSWPRLDSRHFSANSLGRCPDCAGLGVQALDLVARAAKGDDVDSGDDDEADDMTDVRACPSCEGVGLDRKLDGIRLGGLKVHELHLLPLVGLNSHLEAMLAGTAGQNPAFSRVAQEVRSALKRIDDVGLGYLTVSRRVRSLSGGEAQRLKLAGILAENLRGVLYILDEPSQGLHPSELDTIFTALQGLKAAGNTVIIVDHDEQFMRKADWIIDLGPGGGARGGRLMAKFRPSEAAHFVKESHTARHLAAPAAAKSYLAAERTDAAQAPMLIVRQPTLHNLSMKAARFPLGALTVVAGVSGAGKSSLVLSTLHANLARTVTGKKPKAPAKWLHCQGLEGYDSLTHADLIDRRPVAKSSVSMPASYLDVMGELRDIYASQPDAQVLGITAREFSLSVEGGRCPECKGRGELNLKMRFLADARVRCPVCKGARYRPNVLAVRYLGLDIGQVLELTLDQAMEAFRHHRRIVQRLQPAVDLGLGYLKMGQTSASLSGGEAQRLKLVPYLAKRLAAGHMLILDEPTTGLHFEDVGRLLAVLRKLVQAGVTIVMIEHNPDVMAAADWILELGPGAAAAGGRLLYEGPAAGLKAAAGSVIAPYLS